ncbi:hypothetical protein JOM56_010938 [Amanita muscaria]
MTIGSLSIWLHLPEAQQEHYAEMISFSFTLLFCALAALQTMHTASSLSQQTKAEFENGENGAKPEDAQQRVEELSSLEEKLRAQHQEERYRECVHGTSQANQLASVTILRSSTLATNSAKCQD